MLRLIEWKAAEMVSVYYTKPGGLMKAKKLLAVAETGGLRCDINGSAEMGVGNAANLHLAGSSAIMDLPGSIPVTSRPMSARHAAATEPRCHNPATQTLTTSPLAVDPQ